MNAKPGNPLTGSLVRRRGQSLVEFALVAIFFFMIVFGILEVGRLVFQLNSVTNGAREASHYAALSPVTTQISLTRQISPTLFLINTQDTAHFSLTLDCPTCPNCPTCNVNDCARTPQPNNCTDNTDQPLTVTVVYTWTTGVAFPGFGSGIPLRAQSTTGRDR